MSRNMSKAFKTLKKISIKMFESHECEYPSYFVMRNGLFLISIQKLSSFFLFQKRLEKSYQNKKRKHKKLEELVKLL